MTPEVVLAAGYAGLLLLGAVRRWSGCRRTPTAASLRYRTAGLRLRRARTTTGSARRASSCGRTSSTTSAGSCATAPRPTSATRCPRQGRLHRLRPRARDRPPARPVAALRGRPLPPGHRAAASSGSARCSLVAEAARHHRPPRGCAPARRCSLVSALAARWLARDLRAHPANFPAPAPPHGLRMTAPAEVAGDRRRWASLNHTKHL